MTDNTSLEALRLSLAPAIAEAAAFDGWKGEAVTAAAEMEGVDPALAAFAFEGGAMQMISAWIARIDADMADALPASQIGNLPIRERIRRLVQFRLDALIGKEEALRRALAIMAMPQNVPAAARLGWSSA
ncbi:MAG: RpsU-divergently transcribed, partial [Novosphingobium sp. 35-62-5]